MFFSLFWEYEVAQNHKHLWHFCRRKLFVRTTYHLWTELHELEKIKSVFPFLYPVRCSVLQLQNLVTPAAWSWLVLNSPDFWYEVADFCWVFSSVADPLHFGVDPDPDPDPRIHASNKWIRIWIRIRILLFSSLTSRRHQKLIYLKRVFCILLFKGTFTSFFKDKKSKRSHKTLESKVFLTIFASW
jgi:hypothetical protein